MKKIIQTNAAPAAVGPYSQAVIANGTLYISGQIPLDPATGELVDGDVSVQTKRVMENLKAVLSEAGIGFDQLVKCSCFLKDMSDFAAFNDVYAAYLGSEPPARECVEVARLPKDVLVEVSAIAIV